MVAFVLAAALATSGLIVPGQGTGPHPGVLFVHWLGDDAATTNHTEFEADAQALAKRGVTSYLIDAPWSQPHWFDLRRPADDYQFSRDEVVALQRALDKLLAEPNIDPQRIAYVGHDFGAMYGALLAGTDPRPQWYVLMAGTPSFSQWYLLGTKPADVDAYTKQMAALDPKNFLPNSKARGFFFQFSTRDAYITPERELEFFELAPLPRTLALYDSDHSLRTPAAFADRLVWLEEKLGV